MVLFLVDPVKQINKSKDGQRKEDFKQVRNAVDTYYNDYNCYPTTIPFGQQWKIGNTLYMKKVPQDPNCNGSGLCYTYTYDTNNSCPQWNVLFGKLSIAPSQNAPACLLQSDCLPIDYASLGYNLCDFGGNIDCSALKNVTLKPSTSLTPTPIVSPTLVPSPTPVKNIPPDGVYYCACGGGHQTVCNVTFNPPINVQYYVDPQCSNQCGTPC
jgi:hypothetical protein